MSLQNALLTAASSLDLLCVIAIIFFERKNPASTIAWILVLIFLPFIGFAAYAMFGSGFHVNKKRRYALKQVRDKLYKEYIAGHINPRDTGDADRFVSSSRLIRYLRNEGGCFYTRDNSADLFTDGNAMFARMKEDMRAAEHHIHLLYYIFRNDQLGREIAAILTEKAATGVAVRVIYDSLGSMLAFDRLFDGLRAAGGQVEAFSPLRLPLNSHLRLNYRNHRKITVIDGLVGYIGGMNIGDEYLGRHKRFHPWRDTHLRLTGSSVSFLQERFLMDWLYSSDTDIMPETDAMRAFFPPPTTIGSLGMQIVSSGPDASANSIKNGLLEMLYSARSNLYIQTPYFAPDDSFIEALRIAARSGVDVRLMLPGTGDHLLVQAATLSYARQILESGVKVYLYDGFLHAKTMVFDGEAASIGTANIGNRSFALNFEVNAFIYDKALAARCEADFLHDQARCTPLTEGWFTRRSPLARAAYGISRLLAPLI